MQPRLAMAGMMVELVTLDVGMHSTLINTL